MAWITVLKGGTQGQRIELTKDKSVLGRNPDCDVVINGTAVSRAHAYIFKVQNKFYIEDNKSRNGTFVNNQQIGGRTLLKDNDRIKICDFMCTFQEKTAVKLLPAEMRKDDQEEPEEVESSSSTVEAVLSHASSNLVLESQPAEKLKALLEISSNLCKTLELDPLMPKIVESLFTLFRQADRCFIILRDESNKRLIPKVVKTRRMQDETNARFSRSIVNKCMDSTQALLSDDASTDNQFGMSQSISDFRIRSVMCAPLSSQDGKAFGVIQLDTQDRNKKFTQDDLKLLLGVAAQASIAMENAQMHEARLAQERLTRDLELARQVQRGFLPQNPPAAAGYEFFGYYEPALSVGGDYYDFIELPGKRTAALIGDVAGKGVPAALLMAKISADAKFCMLTQSNPAKAVTELNAKMSAAGLAERFVTLAACVLDQNTHKVTLVNAGHPSPLLYHSSTGI